MKKLLLLAMLMTACTTVKPVTDDPVQVTPAPAPPAADISQIIAAHPKCSGFSYESRGVPFSGFLKGLSLSYAKSVCRLREGTNNPAVVMSQKLGVAEKDTLAHYGLDGETNFDRLRKNYALLIGGGMRESSGWYGCGRDASAENTSADTAETGLFQFSYNMHKVSPMLDVLYKEYQANPSLCMNDVYKENCKKWSKSQQKYIPCVIDENYSGSGPGLDFQKFTRHCASFATEYTAVGMRLIRNHWGPFKRHEAQFVPACEEMLKDVEQATSCN